jgi:hypothetical protein
MSDLHAEISDTEDDDTVIVSGAEDIARVCFQGRVSPRQVYRMAEPGRGWPIWRDRRQLHATPGGIRREIRRRNEDAAKRSPD